MDYYERKNLTTVTSFSDPAAVFDFGFLASEQTVVNESADSVMEVSFDGHNVHARLDYSGPTRTMLWTDHARKKIWVRRATGIGGSHYVQVLAAKR